MAISRKGFESGPPPVPSTVSTGIQKKSLSFKKPYIKLQKVLL